MHTCEQNFIKNSENIRDYPNGDNTKTREAAVTVPKPTVPHKVKVIARGFNGLPENIKEELLTNLDNTIDVYLKAIG